MGTVVGKLGGGRTGGEDVLALAVSRSSGRAGGTGKLGVATGGTSRGAGSASGQVLNGRGNCDVKHMGGGWGGGLEIILCRMSRRSRGRGAVDPEKLSEWRAQSRPS